MQDNSPKSDLLDQYLVRTGLVKDHAMAEKVAIGIVLLALILAFFLWPRSDASQINDPGDPLAAPAIQSQ